MWRVVRPTRWAWASLWLTQIMARWGSGREPAVDQLFDGLGGRAVQRGGGLVEEQDRGIELQGPDQGGDLDFAAGEFGDLLFQEGRLASQGGKQFEHSPPIKLSVSVNIQDIRFVQGGLHCIFNQDRSLVEVDDRRAVAGHRVVVDGLAVVANFAPIERIEPGQGPQEQRFPRSRGAGQHEARLRLDGQLSRRPAATPGHPGDGGRYDRLPRSWAFVA